MTRMIKTILVSSFIVAGLSLTAVADAKGGNGGHSGAPGHSAEAKAQMVNQAPDVAMKSSQVQSHKMQAESHKQAATAQAEQSMASAAQSKAQAGKQAANSVKQSASSIAGAQSQMVQSTKVK